MIYSNIKGLEKNFQRIKLAVFDFDGVFTDNIVYVNELGEESVACWRSDGLGLSKLKNLNIPIWVISTEKNPLVLKRCEKLEINCINACENKLSALSGLIDRYQCKFEDVVYVGNDINDSECLKKVGLPIVVADAHLDVENLALYKTHKAGGKGAVREICDLISEYHSHDLTFNKEKP